MVIQEITVAVINPPTDCTTDNNFCRITSKQPDLLIIPAKQYAQNTNKVVFIMAAIPPPLISLVTSYGAVLASKLAAVIISILNPCTVVVNKSPKLMFCTVHARTPATPVDSNIIGIVGYFKMEPTKTMTTGKISNQLHSYMESKVCNMVSILAETLASDTCAFIPTKP